MPAASAVDRGSFIRITGQGENRRVKQQEGERGRLPDVDSHHCIEGDIGVGETANGGMMMGMMSREVKIARPRTPCASRSANPSPSRISTAVTVSAHLKVV